MNPAKKALAHTVKFVSDHRVAIAVPATAVITAVLVRKAIGNTLQEATDFIKEKGLLDEFSDRFNDLNV